MSKVDYQAMTVAELRKLAKENGVVIGAGANKAIIIAKLEAALDDDVEDDFEELLPVRAAGADEEKAAPAPAAPEKPAAAEQPQFRAAWHNPANRYGAGKPGYQRPSYNAPQRTGFGPGAAPSSDEGAARPAPRPPVVTRFGPGATTESAEQRPPYRPTEAFRSEGSFRVSEPAPQPSAETAPAAPTPFAPAAPAPSAPAAPAQRPSFTARPAYGARPAAPQTGYVRRPAEPQETLTPQDLLAPVETTDGYGVLELHPDGYGFLRSETLLPSGRDIALAAAQVKRYGLRSGDRVKGKVRPQREGDKYAAMLTVTSVNGTPADEWKAPTPFDRLTPVYPGRPIRLDLPGAGMGARLADLVAPIGYGSRVMLLAQPEAGKAAFLRDVGNAIADGDPDTVVLTLMLDENPEDVTLFRDASRSTVLASTFDQLPDNHLRISDLTLEYAERMVESGEDVVLIIDSLTKLSKTYTAAAAQQGRSMPGMVNPSSLYRARRLFGAARSLREGGSLTVIGALNVETGNKVDDTIVEEFREAATTVWTLDAPLARAGLKPAFNPLTAQSRRADLFLSQERQEGMALLRANLPAAPLAALQQLQDMVSRTADSGDLFRRLPEWVSLMKNARNV